MISLQFIVCSLQFAVYSLQSPFSTQQVYIYRAEGAEGDREEGSKEEWVERKEE